MITNLMDASQCIEKYLSVIDPITDISDFEEVSKEVEEGTYTWIYQDVSLSEIAETLSQQFDYPIEKDELFMKVRNDLGYYGLDNLFEINGCYYYGRQI